MEALILKIFSKTTIISLRNRKVAMEKQDICRKVFNHAMKVGVKPSLVLSQYNYTDYINRCGGKLSQFWNASVPNKTDFEGSCDCSWITLGCGLFIIQMMSNKTRLALNEERYVHKIRLNVQLLVLYALLLF